MKKLLFLLMLFPIIAYPADTKLVDMTADATPGTDSLIYSTDDPAGTPVDRKSTIAQVLVDGNIPDTITIDNATLAATVSTITGLAPDTATTQAAQPNITSLGTLTTLTVDDVTINGNTISSGGASTLAITPTAGQSITFDGTVELDAGVITGATSITSTALVGALTGNATTSTALAANGANAAAGPNDL